MIKKRRKQLLPFYLIGDIVAIYASFLICYWLRFYAHLFSVKKGIPSYDQYLIIVPFLLLVHMIHFSYQGYYKIKLRRNRLDDLFLVILNTIVTVFIILLIFSYLSSYKFIDFDISRFFLILYVPMATIIIFSFRMVLFKLFSLFFLKKNGISKILIAGYDELAHMTASNLRKYAHFGLEVCGFLADTDGKEVLGSFNDFDRVVKKYGITDLFIALPLREYDKISQLIDKANNLLMDIRLVPDLLQIATVKAKMEHIEGIPVINLGETPLQGWGGFFKRIFDFVFSLIALILLTPIFLVIALLIKLSSRGPVFYVQTRVGLDGRHFRMIKFRTMISNAERDTGAIWSPPDDKRVTGIGRFLRKLSIDELPQLINVLAGSMSLVGPRPERPEFVEKFKDDIPKYMLRHRVKTGMTGWAQVHGLRGNTPLDKRIEFDIFYIQNWSFVLDLEILWRTILKFQFVDKGMNNDTEDK